MPRKRETIQQNAGNSPDNPHVACEAKIDVLEAEVKRLKALLAAKGMAEAKAKAPVAAKGDDWMDRLAPADRAYWQRKSGGKR